MALRWRLPGGELLFQAMALVALGGWLLCRGLMHGRIVTPSIGAVMVISGVGMSFRTPAASWSAMASLFAYAGQWAWSLRAGFNWNSVLGTLCIIWLASRIWALRATRASEDSKPMVSFVLLLRQARSLDAADLAKRVERAWGGDYASAGTERESEAAKGEQQWVVGDSPFFMVQSPEAMFVIHNFPKPYSDRMSEAAPSIEDLRTRRAIEEHRAWIAVDLMIAHDPTRTPESYYPQIARLIAQLADEDCLAILQPESGRINPWDPSLKEALQGPDPLRDFAVPVNPPVIEIDDDDPSLATAVAEARRRWPEFLDAFARKDGDRFAVKAPVSGGGRREFIWILVERIEAARIFGQLANDPVDLGGLKLGDPVDVETADVNDWVYMKDVRPVGLFTSKEVMAARKRELNS